MCLLIINNKYLYCLDGIRILYAFGIYLSCKNEMDI